MMSELPVCRLCKCFPENYALLKFAERFRCPSKFCPMSKVALNTSQWRKLMYVPEKLGDNLHGMRYDTGFIQGHNVAIDKMERGG